MCHFSKQYEVNQFQLWPPIFGSCMATLRLLLVHLQILWHRHFVGQQYPHVGEWDSLIKYNPELSRPFRNQSFANVRTRFEQSLEPFLKGKKSGWKFPIIAQSKLVNCTKFICYYRVQYMKLFKWFFVWASSESILFFPWISWNQVPVPFASGFF
jgi:hypothetical protein